MSYVRAFIILASFTAVLYLVLSVIIGEQTGPNISSGLLPYVNEWKADMNEAGIAYEEGFYDIRQISIVDFVFDNAGKSNRMQHLVYIDEQAFKAGPYSVKATLYHELGHYVFQLEHDSCVLMEKTGRNEDDYADNWEVYLAQYLSLCESKRH